MTHKHARRARPPEPGPAPRDHSWAARATALQQERPAQWAMLAAIGAMLTALAGWVVVLVAPGGNVRSSPMFWLLALPLLPWVGALQSQARWAVNTVWLALIVAPGLALAVLFVAPLLRDGSLLDDGPAPLDTPLAMLVILGLAIMFAAAGAVALRRSSLPGGTRPAAFLPPGTMPAGVTRLPPSARLMLMQGSLPFSGALINGTFIAIVTSLDPLGGVNPVWPGVLQAGVGVAIGVSVFRGGFRLARRRPGAGQDLRRGWIAGMVWAGAAVPVLWLWPTLFTAKLAFTAFMLPIALAAAWCGRKALRALPGVLRTAGEAPCTP